MIDSLYRVFHSLGYRWKIAGILTPPTQDDLETVIDRAKELLYAEPIPSQLEVPGLLVRRTGTDTFDIYVKIGDNT